MAQEWLVILVRGTGGIYLYRVARVSGEDACTVVKHDYLENFTGDSPKAVRAIALQQNSLEDSHPVLLGTYPGQYLAEKQVRELEDLLFEAYINLFRAGDAIEAEGSVRDRDDVYLQVPRNEIGNKAFKQHTGLDRTEQTI